MPQGRGRSTVRPSPSLDFGQRRARRQARGFPASDDLSSRVSARLLPRGAARVSALTLPLRGACGATITLDARRLEKPWHRLTGTNEGEALTDLIVYAALSNE